MTDEDLNKVLDEVAAIKASVDEIKNSDISEIKDEVANLDTEVEDILEKLQELLSANAVVQGSLRIANLGDLEVAQDLIGTEADDPEVTIQGDLFVLINATNGLADSIAAVNAITNKIKIVQGTATITTNSAVELNALNYISGAYDISGTGSVADSGLRTINGSMNIDLGGDLNYAKLNSVGGDGLRISQTTTVTSVDFSGIVSGNVLTGTNSVVLPNAISVKLGGVLPEVVTLSAATFFESSYAGSSQSTTTIMIDGPNATFSLGATAFTGQVTITTSGDVNLPQLTATQALGIYSTGENATIDLSGVTEISGATTLSATTINISSLESSSGAITLFGPTSVSLPALTTLEGDFVAEGANSFEANELSTTTGTINLESGATVSLKGIGDATDPNNDLLDWANIKELTLTEQSGNLDLSGAVALEKLHFSGLKADPIGPGNQNNSLSITSANASLTSLEFGDGNYLGSLNIDNSTLESLETNGVIITTVVNSNTSLETFSFGHSHLDGDNATEVTITNNPEIESVDLSSLSKVKQVVITDNAALETIMAPNVNPPAEPVATVTVTINNNNTSGTYDPAKAPTETTQYEPASATADLVSSFKPFIEAYLAQTRSASVTYNIDVDNVDDTDTTATETSTLSTHLDANTAAQNGPDGTSGNADDQTDGGAVSTENELDLFE